MTDMKLEDHAPLHTAFESCHLYKVIPGASTPSAPWEHLITLNTLNNPRHKQYIVSSSTASRQPLDSQGPALIYAYLLSSTFPHPSRSMSSDDRPRRYSLPMQAFPSCRLPGVWRELGNFEGNTMHVQRFTYRGSPELDRPLK